jgi:outer membrane protein assembly factor BamD
MFKNLLILLLSFFLLYSCSKSRENIKENVVELNPEEEARKIYAEAVKALLDGDAFYAGKKFKEIESLMPQDKYASKASLMAAYADYSRNAYAFAIFALERHLNNYPADENIPYVHYLIAICHYEQILNEKKDLGPLLKAKEKFEFITKNFPDTDYAMDARFKLDLITDQLAAKEMSIARFYMRTEKWIPALNRLKIVVEKYDTTIFVEEALHRLVEIYYRLGLLEEAKKSASILGYNYQSSEWYKKSYKVFNKKYKLKDKKKKKEMGLIRKKIKSLFE